MRMKGRNMHESKVPVIETGAVTARRRRDTTLKVGRITWSV
jgi:hypothetical protein